MTFFGGRNRLARAVVLCLTGGLLAAGVGSTGAPASASIVCRETFIGNATPIAAKPVGAEPFAGQSTISVAAQRPVASVRVTMDIQHPDASTLQVFVTPPDVTGSFDPNSKLFDRAASSGPINGYFTFEDSAATSITGANKPPGLYRPATPLKQVADRPSAGNWLIWINNWPTTSAAAPAGQVRFASITLTYADCPDANGDGLHDDADGDGVLFPPDNCQDLANPDQLDSDADGLGDVCDPTPLLPPAQPVGEPGPRDLTMKYLKKQHRFKGSISSPVASCARGVEVELWKKRKKGSDRRIAKVRTTSAAKFRSGKVRKRGTYYAKVSSAFVDLGAVECVAKVSRRVKVRR